MRECAAPNACFGGLRRDSRSRESSTANSTGQELAAVGRPEQQLQLQRLQGAIAPEVVLRDRVGIVPLCPTSITLNTKAPQASPDIVTDMKFTGGAYRWIRDEHVVFLALLECRVMITRTRGTLLRTLKASSASTTVAQTDICRDAR